MSSRIRHLRGWARRKPGIRPRIDWSHPLAKGLVFCCLADERSGLSYDLVSRQACAAVPGTWQSVPIYDAFGISMNGASNVADYGDRPSWRPNGSDITILAFARAPSDNAAGRPIIAKRSNSNPFPQFSLYCNLDQTFVQAAGKFMVDYQQDTSNYIRLGSNSTSLCDGNYHQFGAAFSQGLGSILYYDGLSTPSTLSTAGSWPLVSNTDPLQVGHDNGGGWFNGVIVYVYYWTRYLNPAEVYTLHQNPFQFFQQQPPRRFFFGPPFVGTGTPPVRIATALIEERYSASALSAEQRSATALVEERYAGTALIEEQL